MDPVSAVVSTGGCSTDRAAAAAAWWRGPTTRLRAQPTARRMDARSSADHTTFLCQDNGKLHRFGREVFLIDGAFPGAALLAADAARGLAWRGIRSPLVARRHRQSGRPR
jgi:phosphate-selective porin